jgi:hypothetical protein
VKLAVLLGAGCASGIAWQLLAGARRPEGFRWLAVTALVLLSAYLCTHLRASLIKARFFLLLVCFAVMGATFNAWPMLALMLLAAWTLSRVGQGTTGELAALFLLYQPVSFLVLEQPQPLAILAWLGVGLLCTTVAARSRAPA